MVRITENESDGDAATQTTKWRQIVRIQDFLLNISF